MPDHPRQLDDVAQLHLAPLPARVRLAQRGHERACLGAELLACLGQRPQLRLEPAARLPPLLIELQQLRVDAAELLLERRHELLDGLLALVEIALGLDLRRLELGARHLGELRHARLQRLGAQRLERLGQPLLGVAERLQPLLRERPLVVEVSARFDQLVLELAGAGSLHRQRAQARAGRHGDEPRAEHQSDQQPECSHHDRGWRWGRTEPPACKNRCNERRCRSPPGRGLWPCPGGFLPGLGPPAGCGGGCGGVGLQPS